MGKQTFQVDIQFIGNISDLQSKIKSVAGEISKIGSTSGGMQVQQQFDSLTRSIAELQTRAAQPIGSQAEFNRLSNDLSKAEGAFNNLINAVSRLQSAGDAKKLELLPADQQAKIKAAENALSAFEKAINSAGISTKELNKLNKELAENRGIKKTATAEVAKYTEGISQAQQKIKELQGDEARLTGELEQAKTAAEQLNTELSAAKRRKNNEDQVSTLTAQLDQAKGKVAELNGQLGTVRTQLKNASAEEAQFNTRLTEASNKANSAASAIRSITAQIKGLGANNTTQLQSAFDQLRQKAVELNTEAGKTVISLQGIGTDATPANIEQLTTRFQQLKSNGLIQANAEISKTVQNLQGKLAPALRNMRTETQRAEQAWQRFNQRQQEVNQFKSQLTYFFSLTNSVYLFRAALQSAFETVKELDAVMTEAAVVTDFSVSDMWDRLPQYTKEASALGASVKDLYSATTLYYQQGLKTNEAMGVGIETMKMARIAGMDASEATEAMTAALRGFNMEVDETNAEKINDVYSKLAAITASDTEQIATAMTKTASIAHSANMEFETTAALLAQIIETTQEAPETAGTAMKTIIARFSEVKELQNQGKKTGKDEEGEDIDVNKIDKALKSVGISMDGFFAGTQGLDEILLELASIWDTLDFSTQRYIATMAAGSRQQSRFIAMMSDYARTSELVDAAHNSAGASALQFEKTLDSMESKLNQLKNAWDQFTMGIADNEILKTAIEMLTNVLEALNTVINGISGIFANFNEEGERTETTVSRLVKSVLSLVAAFAAIRVGKGLLETAFAKISLGFEDAKKREDQKRQKGIKKTEQIQANPGQELEQSARNAGTSLTAGAEKAGEILIASAKKTVTTTSAGEDAETKAAIAGEEAETEAAIAGNSQETVAAVAGEETEEVAALKATYEEQALALEGEYVEAMAAAEGEGAEAMAAVESEYQEKFAALDAEYNEKLAALEGESTETEASVAGEGTEAKAALASEGTEAAAAVAGETAEKIASLDSETAEKIAALEGEYIEAMAAAEGEGAEAIAAVQAEYAELVAALEGEYLEQIAAITGEKVEEVAAVSGETAELLAALKGKIGQGIDGNGGGFFKKLFSNKRGLATGAGIIAAIAIIAGANSIVTNAINSVQTAEKALASLTEMEQEFSKSTSEAATALKNFSKTKFDLKELNKQIGELTKGSAEWAGKIHEAREQMYQILDTYPDLRQYTETVNGVISFTEEGWEEYEKALNNTYVEQATTLYGIRAQKAYQQDIVNAENLNTPMSTMSASEQAKLSGASSAGVVVGGIGGAAIGWKIGAGLGSVIAPGLGTAIGALAGVILGGVIGWLAGDGAGVNEGVSPDTFNKMALRASDFQVTDENGEQIEFDALNATKEQIEEFSKNMAETFDMDADELANYIENNREEFAEHTKALVENQQALAEWGRELGYTKATDHGLEGQQADAYANVLAYQTSILYDDAYQKAYDEIGKLDDKEKKEIAKLKGYTYENGKYKDKDGKVVEEKDFSVEDQKTILASHNAMESIAGDIDQQFNFNPENQNAADAQYILSVLRESGKNSESDITGQLTWNQITAKGVSAGESYLDFINKEQGIINSIGSVDQYKTEDKAADLESRGFDTGTKIDYKLTRQEKTWFGTTYEHPLLENGKFEFDLVSMDEAMAKAWLSGTEGFTEALGKKVAHTDITEFLGIDGVTWEEDNYYLDKYVGMVYDDEELYKGVAESKGVDRATAEQYYNGKTSREIYALDSIDQWKEDVGGYVQDMDFLMTVPLEAAKKFGDKVSGIAAYYEGIDYEQFSADINEMMKAVPEDLRNMVANTFVGLDFKNLNELKDFEVWLRGLPGETDKAADKASDLIYNLQELGIALAQIDLEELTKQMEGLFDVIDKIDELELEEEIVLSKEDVQNLISTGEYSRDDFFATKDGFELMTGSMDELRSTIMETNKYLLELQIGALQKKVETGAFATSTEGLRNLSWGTTEYWTSEQIDTYFDEMLKGAKIQAQDAENRAYAAEHGYVYKDGKYYTEDGKEAIFAWNPNTVDYNDLLLNRDKYLKGTPLENVDTDILASALGLVWNEKDGKYQKNPNEEYAGIDNGTIDFDNLDVGLQTVIREDINETGEAVVNKDQYNEQLQNGTKDLRQQTLSYMETEDLLNVDIASDDSLKDGDYTKEDVDYALQSRINQNNLQKNLDDASESLDWNTDKLEKNKKQLKAHIVSADEGTQAIDKMNEVLTDQNEVLKNGDKNSTAYKKAISKVTAAAQDVFGDHIDTDFVEEHIEDFNNLAEGGEKAKQAWENITQASGKKFLDSLNLSSDKIKDVNAQMSALDGMNLEVGGTADFSNIFNQLAALMGSAANAEAYLESLGYEVTWVENGTITDPLTGMEMTNYVALVTKTDETGGGYNPPPTGGGGDSSKWENPYDKLHNTLEKINDTIREREKLERRYQSLLDRQLLTLKEARDLYKGQMNAYDVEAGYQKHIISERYKQIEDEIAANPGMEKYVQVVDDGYGGKSIRIDWDALEAKDGKEWEEGEDVEAFYDSIKEWLDSIYEAEEKLDEISDAMWELINQGKDEYLDLEDQVIEALINERQEEIDKLSEINDTINDTNSKLLDSMQKQLDEYRQDRDNKETEEELTDKQRKLAYLQQDTSGANALEIMQLQEELDEATEDYTDTLIDQKISELQEQNDKAAEQRQQQIDILQAQLDHDEEVGAFNAKAEALIDEVMANNGIISGTELEALLKDDQNWESMSKLGRMNWLDELTTLVAEAVGYRDKQTSIDDLIEANKLKENDKITFTTADGQTVNGTVQADGTVRGENGAVYSNVTRDWLGNYSTTEKFSSAPAPEPEPEKQKPQLTTNDKKGVSAAIWNGGYGWGTGSTRVKRLKEVFGNNDIQTNYVNKRVMSGYSGKLSDYSYENMKKKFVAYKTGGLADFTGPAWLDGTKSKPEYILNAEQTKAFFTLVDVLSGLQTNTSKSAEKTGDNTYDIDINVESIGSDYDVEQIAATIKRLINEDARYRNNNTVNLMR